MNDLKRIPPNMQRSKFAKTMLVAGWGMGLALYSSSGFAAICTVSPIVAPVFGSYQGVNLDATGSITVNCTSLLPESVSYSISLSLGSQALGTQRRMVQGSNYLNYNFFCSSGYSQIWADGLGGTCANSGGGSVLLLLPLITTYTVYGRIAGGQFVAAGIYNDTVSIRVLY